MLERDVIKAEDSVWGQGVGLQGLPGVGCEASSGRGPEWEAASVPLASALRRHPRKFATMGSPTCCPPG